MTTLINSLLIALFPTLLLILLYTPIGFYLNRKKGISAVRQISWVSAFSILSIAGYAGIFALIASLR